MSEYKTHGLKGRRYKEVWQSLYEKQGGKCAICGTGIGEVCRWSSRPIDKLFIDHCHETGKVRGLLCTGCNSHLGMYELKTGTSERCLFFQTDTKDRKEREFVIVAENDVLYEYRFWEYLRRALLRKHQERTVKKIIEGYKALVDEYLSCLTGQRWQHELQFNEQLKQEHQAEIAARRKHYREEYESREKEYFESTHLEEFRRYLEQCNE